MRIVKRMNFKTFIFMILTHHGIWDAGHGLTHEDTYSFELFRIMDE